MLPLFQEDKTMLRKLGQNYQFAIPKEIIESLQLHVNDYLDVRVEGNKMIVEPQVIVPKDQAYFYTQEWQADEQKASQDIKNGKVTQTKNLKQLFRKLDS